MMHIKFILEDNFPFRTTIYTYYSISKDYYVSIARSSRTSFCLRKYSRHNSFHPIKDNIYFL